MSHLQNAAAHISAHFPDDWANDLIVAPHPDDTNNDDAVSTFTTALAGRLDVAAGTLFDALNSSVISGEYVSNLETFRQHLTDIEGRISETAANMDILGFPNMTLLGQELVRTNFYYSVKQAIKSYRSLIDFVERHLIYKANTSEILYAIKRDGDQPLESAAKNLDEVFQLNIGLAKIDHSISFKKAYFLDLVLMQHELSARIASNPIAEILLKKCNFLLYKMSFRLKQSKENYLYSIDFVYSTIQPIPVQDFKRYNDIIDGHYGGGLEPHSFEIRVTTALNKLNNGTLLELDDFHALIKHFKDNKQDLDRLQQLRVRFKTFRDQGHGSASLFDKKALDIAFCYLENNILSLEIQKNVLTLSNWKSKLKEYTDRAENFENKNFFPYYKIVKEYLSEIIKQQFLDEADNFKVIESLIKDFEDNLSKLGANLGISEETDYLAFQSTMAGCVTEIDDSAGTRYKCFISSSFVLPLHYKEYREELETFKAKFSQFQSMLEIKRMIDKDRKSVKEVKDEIQKTDKRHIEILSIFAALVMFVSNEIQIFTKINNIANAAAYSFFFAFGLGVFVLMIWLITRYEGKNFKKFTDLHWFVTIFMSIGLIGSFIFIFKVGLPNADQRALEKMQFQIDSVKKANLLKEITAKPSDTTNVKKIAVKNSVKGPTPKIRQ
jgi:hypothetical protein